MYVHVADCIEGAFGRPLVGVVGMSLNLPRILGLSEGVSAVMSNAGKRQATAIAVPANTENLRPMTYNFKN